jgi:exopolyphosphatase / guanosine-5'-triphosphate,3'-diphosphate pyrophosphatase
LKVSVIDLGFNSLKLVTYGVRDDKSFYVIEQRSVSARLGEGMKEGGYLQLEPMHRTIEGLELFKEIIDSESIKHHLPIATSAVREAQNREEFVKQIRRETGFAFRVLSEKEEAYYSYAGAFRSIFEPNVLFFDLGGGSLEMVRTVNFGIRKATSLPLGALRLTQMFANRKGTYSKKNYSRMRKYTEDLIPDSKSLSLRQEKTALIGVGGSVRALASFDQEMRDYPLNKVHRYAISKKDLEFIQTELVESKISEISKFDAIGDERARTITAGATVIDVMMEKLAFKELVVSTQGLRDGILAAYLADPAAYHAGNPTDVRKLIKPREINPLQFSSSLVTPLLTNRLIDQREYAILRAAVSHILNGLPPYRPYALFHILMDEDANMSHESQLEMSLSIVRMLRPKASEWLYSKYKSVILKPQDKNRIKRITSLLRFAMLIEKTRAKVKVYRYNDSVVAEVFPSFERRQTFPIELYRLAIRDVSSMIDIIVKLHHEDSDLEELIQLREES